MSDKSIRVAINGYGVIGKRVADAVTRQDDMQLAGIADTAADWRLRVANQRGYRVFAATPTAHKSMSKAGMMLSGNLDDLLDEADIVVDCTPKHVATGNVALYRKRRLRFIVRWDISAATGAHWCESPSVQWSVPDLLWWVGSLGPPI